MNPASAITEAFGVAQVVKQMINVLLSSAHQLRIPEAGYDIFRETTRGQQPIPLY
jgi:hypothetical protein